KPPPAPARVLPRARGREAQELGATLLLRRGRVPRFHAHRFQPPGDVARHLPRQQGFAPGRAEKISRQGGGNGKPAAIGRRCSAGEAVRRGPQRARSMAEVLELKAASRAAGTVRLPGSKSISNRVLLLAALAAGDTKVTGLLDAEDTLVMRKALSALGVSFTRETVLGAGGAFPVKRA